MLSRKLRARLAYVKSFFSSSRGFTDYPLDYVDQSVLVDQQLNRHTPHWRADLLGLPISGLGENQAEAYANLRDNFDQHVSSGGELYRPGSEPTLEFASSEKVSRYPELRDDFIQRILHLDWAFLSDESSLWDFHGELDNDVLIARIIEVYGVDVTHIEGAVLWQILEQIHAST